MDVSIIIINYNTFELTKNTIENLISNTSNLDYEIIVVDNQSPDGSGEELKNYFKDSIVYIQANANLGTSKAFNMGVNKSQGKYVLWLNPDVVIYDNFIYDLFSFMENNNDCGVCGGNLLGIDKKPTHSFRTKMPTLKTISKDLNFCHRILKKVFHKSFDYEYNYKNRPIKVGYITGADMLVRKSIIDEIGAFNEEIFMYSEEVEFQYRVINKTDYSIYSVPNASLIHLEGGSFTKDKQFNDRRFRLSIIGQATYMKLSYGDEYYKKFLLLLLKKYKKIKLVYSIVLSKKRHEYAKKIQIINELLEMK